MKSKRRLRGCRRSSSGRVSLLAAALTLAGFSLGAAAARGSNWVIGDVFAGTGGGMYQVYSNAGAFKETIDDGTFGFPAGCAFNAARDKLYTTEFSSDLVVVYDNTHPHAILQTIATGDTHPQSIAFDRMGSFYVSHANGGGTVKKFDAAGSPTGSFSPALESGGVEQIALSSDQCTLFYTSPSGKIKRFNLCSNAQLPDFADIGGSNHAFRLLPPFDGSGGLLVTNDTTIKRLNGSGSVIQSYDAVGQEQWSSLALAPNGTSFWSGSTNTGSIFRFNISSGAVEAGPIATGSPFFLASASRARAQAPRPPQKFPH